MIEPLPFSIRIPKSSEVTFMGFEEVKSELDGLLHLEDGHLVFEWQVRERVERFRFDGIGADRRTYDAEALELPAEWIAEVSVRSLWFVTWVRFRARRLDAFDAIPTGQAGILTIRVGPEGRPMLRPMLEALDVARRDRPYRVPEPTKPLLPVPEEEG